MLYRPIVKRAWLMAKKVKSLWFFGLFTAILGLSGEFEIVRRAIYLPTSNSDTGLFQGIINSFRFGWENSIAKTGDNLFVNFGKTLINAPTPMFILFVIIIIMITVALFFVWLAVVSQIGLIRNASLVNKNKKPTINEGIDFAVKNFWPVALVDLVIKIVFAILFGLMGWIVAISINIGWIGVAAYYLAFIIFTIVIFAVSFISKYQILYLILKGQKIAKALSLAWKTLKANLMVSIEMAAVIFCAYLVGALIGIVLFSFPIGLVMLIYANFKLPFYSVMIILTVSYLVIIVLLAWIAAFLTAFQWSAWTILFERITEGGAESKVTRTSEQIANYFNKK